MSVGLPSYQQRELLREAIESVLAQEYPDFEIVIGDDGSTDGTHEMLREYGARHPDRIKVILAIENRGTTANWNQILAACTGEFIAWLDGDDLMLPGRLRAQAAWLAAHSQAVICYGNVELFNSATGARRLQHNPGRNPLRSSRGPKELLRSAAFFATSAVMMRRSAVPAGGADTRIKFISDWLVWLEIAQHGDIGYVDDVVTRYRMHGGNITTRRNDLVLFDQLMAVGIAEAKYPQYIGQTRPHRAELLWGHAIGCLRQQRYERAEMLFERSIGQAWRTYNVPTIYKLVVWLAIKLGLLRRVVPWHEALGGGWPTPRSVLKRAFRISDRDRIVDHSKT